MINLIENHLYSHLHGSVKSESGKLFESCKIMEFRGPACKVYDSGTNLFLGGIISKTNLFLSGIISKTPLVSLKFH